MDVHQHIQILFSLGLDGLQIILEDVLNKILEVGEGAQCCLKGFDDAETFITK